MFVILQKYDFSSKSQPTKTRKTRNKRCLWYCKSTIFQANHNVHLSLHVFSHDVCDTAKVRFFKQITTYNGTELSDCMMFVILQKYDFSSKSQPLRARVSAPLWCLWYCKSTIFQANHNRKRSVMSHPNDVCDTAKVRFFKQITTEYRYWYLVRKMFVILQKYDFSSKSQPASPIIDVPNWCLWYCKSTIFQANHNFRIRFLKLRLDVCDTAKVRFFKQITTGINASATNDRMFVILQKYDFSSKSQLYVVCLSWGIRCLWYCKSTIFQANHNS